MPGTWACLARPCFPYSVEHPPPKSGDITAPFQALHSLTQPGLLVILPPLTSWTMDRKEQELRAYPASGS